MATLKVKKELLDQTVYYSQHNSSYKVKLSEATQEQLKVLHEKEFDIFETPAKAEKTEKEK